MNEQRNLRDAVDGWATRILAAWQKTVSNIVETGRALIDAKADLDHGAFLKMVEGRLPFQRRTAERLMTIASHSVLSNASHASHLPASWMTLAELARLDASTVERLIESGEINPRLERKGVARLLPPPKPKAIPKKAAPAAKPRQTGPVFARPVVIKSEIVPPVMYVPPKTVEPEITPPPKFVYPAPAKSAGPVIEGEIIPYDEAVREGRRLVEQLKIEAPEEFEDEPDRVPPLVHVDAAPGDVVAEHLHDELAACAEEILRLENVIAVLKAQVAERKQEIIHFQARYASLEDRLKRQVERVERAFMFLWDWLRDHGDRLPPNSENAKTLEERLAFIEALIEQDARQPAAPPAVPEPAAQTWNQFVAIYRAIEAPLPMDHPKLIAGMVAWADENGHDVEQIIGAPQEAVEIWTMTAKNFRGQTVAGNSQRENTAKILQRFSDGRRHSIAAMASSLSLKEKFLEGVLDMMFRADHRGMITRDADGKSFKYTMRRPAK